MFLIVKITSLGSASVLSLPFPDKAQWFNHSSFNSTLQLINGISRDLQKILRYFNGFEKLSKYKDLEIEKAKIWQLKTNVTPVILEALGITRKKHCNEQIPGNARKKYWEKINIDIINWQKRFDGSADHK